MAQATGKAALAAGGAAAVPLGLLGALLLVAAVIVGAGGATGTPAASPAYRDLCGPPGAGPVGGPVDSIDELNAEQRRNAQTVVSVAAGMRVPAYAATVALATALQESKLHNYTPADFVAEPGFQDHDSLGIFQQRASVYTEAVAVSPAAASHAFLVRLMGVTGWQDIPLTEAAATVQIPREDLRGEYAKWQPLAQQITGALWPAASAAAGEGPYDPAAPLPPDAPPGACPAQGGTTDVLASGWAPPAAGQLTSGYGVRWGTMHRGIDIAGPLGTPIYAAYGGTVAAAGPASGFGNWVVLNHTTETGGTISTVYGHMTAASILVAVGDTVAAGQQIAAIGSEGESTGPHLHFEVWIDGARLAGGRDIDPAPFLAARGIAW